MEKTWAGKPMWECNKCGDTTFKASEIETHTCKTARFASETSEDDE